MDIVKTVAKVRLAYHYNMVDAVNVANQLKLMSNEKADRANAKHLKEIIDCWMRLGYDLPKEFVDFKNEGS